MKFPTIKEMAEEVAEKALDEFEYKGKTLREWVKIILATDINVATEHGTNLAEVGTDAISRERVIEALGELATFTEDWSCHTWMYTDDVYNAIKQLPTIQPDIVRCKDCKYAEYIDDVQALWCTECGQGRTVAPNDFCSYAERREVTT